MNMATNAGILMVAYDKVQIPFPQVDDVISIIYGSEPNVMIDEGTLVPIPATLLEALLHYIGYRAHGSLDGNIQSENNTHYMRFEASCNRAKTLGVVTIDDMLSTTTQFKGFV